MRDTGQRVRAVLRQALALNVTDTELGNARRTESLLGLDSIAMLEFVLALEKEFGISFDTDDLDTDLFAELDRLTEHIAGLRAGSSE